MPGATGTVAHRALAVRLRPRRQLSAGPTRPRWSPPPAPRRPAWRAAGPQGRAGVAAEILRRINARTFEMAHAVQHTTGQAFVMAFQAGGPHAQDRALEAVAYALRRDRPGMPVTAALGEAAARRRPAAHGQDQHRGRPRRRAGDRLQHVPHLERLPGPVRQPGHRQPGDRQAAPGRRAAAGDHRADRPRGARRGRAGPEPGDARRRGAAASGIAATLATHPDVRIVDFTGSSEFGNWLEANARQAVVYTEKAGLNTVVVDSTDDYKGLLRNLAFSLSLYSGQMCTTPQNILVPAGGIETDAGHRSLDEFARRPRRRASTSCSATRSARPARSARSSTTACWPGSTEASRPRRAWSARPAERGRRAVARTRRSAPR